MIKLEGKNIVYFLRPSFYDIIKFKASYEYEKIK